MYVVVCCRELRCFAMCCGGLQFVEKSCCVLQCVAVSIAWCYVLHGTPWVYVCMCIHIHVYTYTYIHLYTHTYIHVVITQPTLHNPPMHPPMHALSHTYTPCHAHSHEPWHSTTAVPSRCPREWQPCATESIQAVQSVSVAVRCSVFRSVFCIVFCSML